ncbi:MAG: GNAT family N-acetyltransferase [Clostridiales bacterium]|nr:GNAT family N-acetyltransferase [Clostridiales bacterium]
MIRLEPIGPDNWREPLTVREDQRRFVGDPSGILARAYAYRDLGSQAKLILDDDTPVGMLLYYDWPEGGQYVFSHLLIDQRYQRRGFGETAALLALDEMRIDGRYPKVGLCYVEGDEPARMLYEKLGFRHTGEADGDEIDMELSL